MKWRPIHKIVEVEVTGLAKLVATFEDGERREVDLSGELYGEVLEPLRDPKRFAEVTIDGGTLEWPTGLGLDPVVIYECLPQLKVSRLEPDPSLSQAKPRSPR